MFDISSPPLLVRAVERRAFFAGGHPFSRYISRRWKELQNVDTSGGNVGYAAAAAADAMGADELRFFGLDFSYPDGKPYARGTFLPRMSDSRSSRLATGESFFCSMVFGKEDTVREAAGGSWRYSTPLLRAYHASMQEFFDRTAAAVYVAPGRGLPFVVPAVRRSARSVSRPGSRHPGCAQPAWRELLGGYRATLASLPKASNPAAAYIGRLPDAEKEACLTLLPLLPRLEAEGENGGDRAGLLEKAKEWMLSRVIRALDA